MSNDDTNDGKTTEHPLSDTVLKLFQQVRQARSKDERERAMLALADAFASEHDATDHSASEVYHEYIEDFENSKLNYRQDGLRLARLAVDCIERYLDDTDNSPEEAVAHVEKTLN